MIKISRDVSLTMAPSGVTHEILVEGGSGVPAVVGYLIKSPGSWTARSCDGAVSRLHRTMKGAAERLVAALCVEYYLMKRRRA